MLRSRCSQSRADTAATRAAEELRPGGSGAAAPSGAGLSAPRCLQRGLGVRRAFSFISSQNVVVVFFPLPQSSRRFVAADDFFFFLSFKKKNKVQEGRVLLEETEI